MKIRDLTELAARNLREALLRNLLTTLGIGVGIASLVAMLSLGIGLQRLATQRLERSGLFNAIFVRPKSGLDHAGGPAKQPPPEKSPELDLEARQAMTRLSDVIAVYPQIRFLTEIRYDGNSYPTSVAGIPETDRGGGAFDDMQGRFFSAPNADEAILQTGFAERLARPPESLVGKQIVVRYARREPLPAAGGKAGAGSSATAQNSVGAGFSVMLQETRLKIVGIVKTDPEGIGGFGRGQLFVPLEVAEQLHATQITDLRQVLRGPGPQSTYSTLTVRVTGPTKVPAVEDAIQKMGFETFSLLDTTRNLRLFFTVFDLLLGIFGGLALVVATLGIVNTLVMAILERRREIGVLKALGAADQDVRQLFFSEAAVMGLVGGIFGTGLGWAIGRALTFGTDLYLKRRNLPAVDISFVPWWLALGAVAFAVAVSLAAGIYPASRAARLNPVEALKYE
ncbi:MAG TPA: ABC transporter permease [Terriglobia bacterium]|nr:ABC transporter permease [Terriglobia bacterium]